MNRISRNISIIVRAERLIAQRRMSAILRQTGFMAAAGIAAAIGLVLLNFAAYIALSETVTPALAALLIALGNFFIAILLILIGNKSNVESEISAVSEVRDFAMEDLEAEINLAGEELKATAQNLKAMARNPLGSITPGLISALATVLMKTLKK
ncbi:MAG: hypothetical protein ACU0CA_01815 [Paracoccaceae bacterium]